MPGHVKLGKTGEPDPDPSPYLIVSMEMKREAMVSQKDIFFPQLFLHKAKPYDSKKSMWCPDGDGGFKECLLESTDGAKTTVAISHEKKTFKADLVGQVQSSFGFLSCVIS